MDWIVRCDDCGWAATAPTKDMAGQLETQHLYQVEEAYTHYYGPAFGALATMHPRSGIKLLWVRSQRPATKVVPDRDWLVECRTCGWERRADTQVDARALATAHAHTGAEVRLVPDLWTAPGICWHCRRPAPLSDLAVRTWLADTALRGLGRPRPPTPRAADLVVHIACADAWWNATDPDDDPADAVEDLLDELDDGGPAKEA